MMIFFKGVILPLDVLSWGACATVNCELSIFIIFCFNSLPTSGSKGFSRFLESNDLVKVEFAFISKFIRGAIIGWAAVSIDFLLSRPNFLIEGNFLSLICGDILTFLWFWPFWKNNGLECKGKWVKAKKKAAKKETKKEGEKTQYGVTKEKGF